MRVSVANIKLRCYGRPMRHIVAVLTLMFLFGAACILWIALPGPLDRTVNTIVGGAIAYGSPMILSYALTRTFDSKAFYSSVLIFDIIYFIVCPIASYWNWIYQNQFKDERDAMWQLDYLSVPALGLLSLLLIVIVFGAVRSLRRSA